MGQETFETLTDKTLSRRTLLSAAGLAAVSTGLSLGAGGPALGAGRRLKVAVLGGGMGGLAAAHELAERGFQVVVYERKALGGKARSIPVTGTSRGRRRELPGEHGFRFFPGFYHHVPDTMRRIPFADNKNGVGDNLVAATEGKFVRTNGRADAALFGMLPEPAGALTPGGLQQILLEELLKQKGISPLEGEFFANRLMVFLTSSEERRFGQWEKTSWWDFVRAERYSEEYRNVVARGMTRSLVAAKEEIASTRTIGNMAEAFLYNIMNRGNDGAVDRVLTGPTTEAWIDPWVTHLKSLGVQFRVGHTVESLNTSGGRISSVRVRDRTGIARTVVADWFVSAMPVERARRLWSKPILNLDPRLAGTKELHVDWMNGIQFYLREKIDLAHGHISFMDAPWALTALTQGQFWRDDFATTYGDGKAVDCLSVDISDWDSPGILYGKPAKRCTADEIRREVWAQIKSHLEDTGASVLPNGILHSWFLDPAIKWNATKRVNSNGEPLLVNTVDSWSKRPEASTRIPNLFLSGDFVRTNIDLATMEGANESGRAAANALLEAADSAAPRVQMFERYKPPEFEALKAVDATLYRSGLPNVLDRP